MWGIAFRVMAYKAIRIDSMGLKIIFNLMKTYTAVVEKCSDTGLYVGYIPGFPGAHSQGETLDELKQNMHEVLHMLLEDGEPVLEGEFVGTQLISA